MILKRVRSSLYLASSLEGDAARVMANIPRGCVSYTVVSQKLREMFAPEANVLAYKAQFQCRSRGDDEGAHEFSLSLRDLACKAYPDMDHKNVESMLLDQFIKGQPSYIRFALAGASHKVLQEAVAATIKVEAYARNTAPAQPTEPVRRATRAAAHHVRSALAAPPAPPTWPTYDTEWSGPESFAAQAETEGPDLEATDDDLHAELIAQLLGLDIDAASWCRAATPGAAPRICFFCEKPGYVALPSSKRCGNTAIEGDQETTPEDPRTQAGEGDQAVTLAAHPAHRVDRGLWATTINRRVPPTHVPPLRIWETKLGCSGDRHCIRGRRTRSLR